MDIPASLKLIDQEFAATVLPALEEYIRIPNMSPTFDAEFATNGLQENAVALLVDWAVKQNIAGLTHRIVSKPGLTPIILFEVPATPGYTKKDTVLLYGHFDKQPPMAETWTQGPGPRTPFYSPDKKRLYGRGGADDGYSTFSALVAIKCLQAQGAEHPRLVTFIEGSEESGSVHLESYLKELQPDLGDVSLVICLDSGCGNYDQLWLTTSLRGVMSVHIKAEVMKNGVHSGSASGIVPSSFRCLRQVMDQLEDATTGRVLVPELYVSVPPRRVEEARQAAAFLGSAVYDEFPRLPGVKLMSEDVTELILNRSWRPTVSYTGVDGLPAAAVAGNVLRAFSTLVLSFRLPPTADPLAARDAIDRVLRATHTPAALSWKFTTPVSGWNAPEQEPWLTHALDNASHAIFGKDKPCAYMGEGGSIGFMSMLHRMFPRAQFMITGVLGPASNAHGPDEFLHIPMAKGVTAAVAHVVATKAKGSH